jgi:hypothetical protein
MPTTHIIPRTPAELCEWFNNFVTGFPAVSTTLGFSDAERDKIVSEGAWVIYACRTSADATSLSQAWTDWRDRLLDEPAAPEAGPLPTASAAAAPAGAPPAPGVISRFRSYIRRIKAAPNYTSSIGESLRLVAVTSPVDDATVKPDLTAEPLANFKARVRLPKRGFPGLIVQARREGEADWTELGVKTSAVFVDERPTQQPGKPEVVNYRAIYSRNDQPVGQWSDVVTVTKQP